MDLNKLENEFEKIVGSSCESTSAQERIILTQRAIGKYYKTEHELLKKENDQIDEQMAKDGKQIEETEKKIQEVKEIKDQLISAMSTLSTATIHLLARKNEVQEDVIKWENKINKTAEIMENFIKKETAKREEGNDIYKQVIKKRNNITALQIERAVLEKRIEVQQRQIKQQKEINCLLFRNEIVEFVKSVTTHNRIIQLNKDIAKMKLNLNEMSVKFNQLSLNKLSTFKVRSVFATSFQQTALNNRGNTLKSVDKTTKTIKGQENSLKVVKPETTIISKQPNKTTSSTLKIQPPKTLLSSTDHEDNDRKEFQQRSDERKRKYLHLMSTSFDDLAKNYQENTETNIKETPKTNVEKENSQKRVIKKIEKKPSKEENITISSKNSSKKIKLIDNVKIQQSPPVEGLFLIPKSIEGRKPKKVSFAERKTQEEVPLTDDTNHNHNNSVISGNESNQSFTFSNTEEREISKFFKNPEGDRSVWEDEDNYEVNNEVNYSFLTSQYNTTKTPTDNTNNDSTAQDNFFLTPSDNGNMLGFDFGMGNQQASSNPFSLF
ncbi:peptidoglycan DL-endopeptidase CwlO-like isoform X1 [Onthophagus taurus]|uniref:peptidoglycan DL-endopeptidase CwlO-like isoform X1 n=1 Tax=Onthophagus taurus TaxID=166361 RepID=UPI0039BE1744